MSFDHLIVSDTNECTEFPCQHNGTCLNNEGSYKCDCTAGWKDKDCKTGALLNEPFPYRTLFNYFTSVFVL